MNRSVTRRVISLLILSASAAAVQAAQPPDSVKSDGEGNTAMGAQALLSLSSGALNTASGAQALLDVTSGDDNTGLGANAIWCLQTGSDNTAVGYYALALGTDGYQNTAVGSEALALNTGSSNTAIGFQSAYHTTGPSNTALGRQALLSNTTGAYNIGVGDHGGQNLTTGSNNIDIGNVGDSGDNAAIRIGTEGTQTAAYMAGINDSQVTGAAVYVTASGRLGVLASSERYKTAIAPLGPVTSKLEKLRPVSFHLKNEPSGAVQYGLIAEEVEKVYPELVIRDANGKIQGVRYDELAPLLLNVVQRQQQQIAQLEQRTQAIQATLEQLQPTARTLAMR